MKRVVVVLGGNAFASRDGRLTMCGQLQFAHESLCQLRPLLDENVQLLISHGNGPQVGHILTRVEEALGKAYSIPLEVCVAESEGELGYVLEQSLINVLAECGQSRSVVSLLTQVVVEEDDEAFEHPTKPIGPFYDMRQAERLREKGFAVVEDAGRGFRRVVPSPKPREIVELDVIRRLFELGVIVIAAGGGGIPVVRRGDKLSGIEAVIDKDLTAALIADRLQADTLIVLTCVPCAYKNFDTPHQDPINRLTVEYARQLLSEGHFAPGSMCPKIEAAIQFASQPERQVIICDPRSLAFAMKGQAGTIVRQYI